MPAESCPACQSHRLTHYIDKESTMQRFAIGKCGACGSAFAFPRPLPEQMDRYYSEREYADLTLEQALEQDGGYHPDSTIDAARIIGRCREFGQGDAFVDIGAGFGFFSREAVARGYRVRAIEPNPNSAAGLRRYADLEPLEQPLTPSLTGQLADSADVVLLSQVLEHLVDLDRTVLDIRTILRRGGLAAIAVPHFGSVLSRLQGRKDMYLTPPEHLNAFSKAGLHTLFQRHGFETVLIETVSKLPKRRIEARLGGGPFGSMAWRAFYGLLHSCDMFGGGMVINAYFQRPR